MFSKKQIAGKLKMHLQENMEKSDPYIFNETVKFIHNFIYKEFSINSVSVSLFNEALTLMRDLAEHQNGAPLIRHEEEYNKTMNEVWDFLEANKN